MALTRLNLTKCIIIGDARRLEEGKEPIRNIIRLCRELEKIDEDKYQVERIQQNLYNANRQGLSKVDDDMLENIKNILMVEEHELLKSPRC